MKLYYKFGAMNSGKTMEILRTAHNYEENGYKVIVVKPSFDKKGNKNIISRMGAAREVDYLVGENELVSELIKDDNPKVILADETQFFSKEQIEDLWLLTKEKEIKVFCYGLKTDFQTNSFPGAKRLFELADKIEEITTLCECGEKAMFNLRKENGVPVFDGSQVAIDGFEDVTYEPVCGNCYINKFKNSNKGMTRTKIFKGDE